MKKTVEKLKKTVENSKKNAPLVHCITNYVTVNDVANVILACGGSPIMSDEPADVFDIVSLCGGLCINIGTLNERSIKAMHIAGARAKELGKPILLDPVGAGASKLRTETATEILGTVKPEIIRGNISEIKALALGAGTTKGVDADIADAVTEKNLCEMADFIKSFAKRTGAVIAVTGKTDLVADAENCYVIRNGRAEMSRITGTGCMLSGIAAAYAAANPQNLTDAVAAAVCVMGIAGEIGVENMSDGEGNASLRTRIIDAVYNMNTDILQRRANYEIR